jgi:hypothetical protein
VRLAVDDELSARASATPGVAASARLAVKTGPKTSLKARNAADIPAADDRNARRLRPCAGASSVASESMRASTRF